MRFWSETFTGPTPVALAVADFNVDGRPDVAVVNSTPNNFSQYTVGVVLGQGAGTFTSVTQFPVGTNPRSVAAGDFDGDGKLDLVVANQTNASQDLSVLLGDGSGGFGPAVNHSSGGGLSPARQPSAGSGAAQPRRPATISGTPLMGDWTGTGTRTVGTYERGTFKLKNSNSEPVPGPTPCRWSVTGTATASTASAPTTTAPATGC